MSNTTIRPDILTRSGQYFNFLDPSGYQLDIEDIAHALANCCRFAGHCKRFYSVAQHSVYVSRIVPEEDAFAGLMHDCAEAFLGDVSKPLKQLLPDYRVIEKRVEAVLFEKLCIPYPLPESVKKADMQMLWAEQAAIMPPHDDVWSAADPTPTSVIVTPLWPDDAFNAFMERYAELINSRAAS